MILYGLGSDIVEIKRFENWHHKSYYQLTRIFTPQEIVYALASPAKTAERFAVRFAAREAFYKALHSLLPEAHIPLLTVIRNVSVTHTQNGVPELLINWPALTRDALDERKVTIKLSLTHTRTIASAVVLIIINF